MDIIKTDLPEVLVVEPDVFADKRGFFMETYNKKRYQAYGISDEFVQDNMSMSQKNVLRGLHFQLTRPQAKLVQVISGEVFDVAVDIRRDSEYFGKWTGVRLSGENKRQLYVPKGFAHGFCVLSDQAVFSYKCSDFYAPGDEGGIAWNDPKIGIKWPVENPVVSEKDKGFSFLDDHAPHELPRMGS